MSDDFKTEFYEFIGARIVARIEEMERRVLAAIHKSHNNLEEQLTAQSTALSRLQDDNTAMKTQIQTLQDDQTAQFEAIDAANARFQKSIDDLKALAGNDDALNAIATDMEAGLATLQAVTNKTTTSTTSEGGLDQPPVTQPTAVVITPSSAAIAPGGTQQFSSSVPSNWSAVSGSIDANGLYTSPTDPSIIGDVVTATPTDGTTASASVPVTIG